jgi:ABC-type multidrug transport system fused ATPase/permease subunit
MNAALWLIAPLNRIINSAGKIAGAPVDDSLRALAPARLRPRIGAKSDCRMRSIMVHTTQPERRGWPESRDVAWTLFGSTRPRHPSPMKHFVRLVKFAWPYKFRFGLSVCCAAMVALLFFSELGAVSPGLHILFDSQTPKRWISEKIMALDEQIDELTARKAEAAFALEVTKRGDGNLDDLKKRFQSILSELAVKDSSLHDIEARLGLVHLSEQDGQPFLAERTFLKSLRRDKRIAEGRKKELSDSSVLLRNDGVSFLERRLVDIDREIAGQKKWRWRYERLQPYVVRYLPNESFKTLLLLLAFVMLAVAFKGLFMFLQEVLVADVMQLTLFDIRNLFFRRTLNLDLASFSDQGSSELMARFTSDMDSFSQGLNTLMSKLIREPLRIVSCLGGALWFNWRLTLLTLILVPISAAATYRVGKIMKRAVRRSLESMSTIYKILQESFQGIKVVKSFAMERIERRRFFGETKSLYRKSVRVAMIDALSDPVLEMLTLTTVLIALLAGSYLVLNKTIYLELGLFRLQLAAQPMAIQDVMALYAVLAGVSDPIRKLANVHSKIQRASAAADRICALMDRSPRIAEIKDAVILPRHRRAIEFDCVTFSYVEGTPVLHGVNLTVRHGETIALVGPNGCGKTTLMNLLPRFWDVDSGAIRIDGYDIRDVQIRSLRRQIGVVLQETILFQDTIANNIAYGSPHASRSAIIEAAERAYAHQFISALPQGYDTVVGERGYGLSGGQRQRLALARAMLCDPAILILDEATSAVDIQDEVLIRKAIEEFALGRTTFLISHNLTTIQFAHRIVLLNGGCIEAVGTDQELKRFSGLYRRLHEIHYLPRPTG